MIAGRIENVVNLVRDWYRVLPKPIRNRPTLDVPGEEIDLIVSLLQEETAEFDAAMSDRDIVRVADALADIVYVVYGASLQFGFDLDVVLQEVHRANMSKSFSDGHYEFDPDGKVRRGDNYRAPDLEWLRESSPDP